LEEVLVTDPVHPLYGRRFQVHTVTGGDIQSARVFVVYRGDQRLMILREATNLSVLERTDVRSKLSARVVRDFLALVKEYELCLPAPKPSGSVSRRRGRKKS
jgi:hypothetical protein